MKIRNVLCIAGFSFLLCSCDFVMNAYKETFYHPDETVEDQGANEDEAFSESGGERRRRAAGSTIQNTPPVVEEINLLEDAAKLDEVQQRLQGMFPEKSLEIFPPHIYFETKRIRLQLVDPNIPGNIDWYYYRADTDAWEKEDPVKTMTRERRKPIPLNAVKFSTANDVYHQLIGKLDGIEGAEAPTTIYFSFHVQVWNWNTRINGSRADYTFRADKDGKEIEFERL